MTNQAPRPSPWLRRVTLPFALACALTAASTSFATPPPPAPEPAPAVVPDRQIAGPSLDDLGTLGPPVLHLLQTHDVETFATALATTSLDWVALIEQRAADTSRPRLSAEAKSRLADRVALRASYSPEVEKINRNRLTQAGERLLREAAALNLDFTKGKVSVKALVPGKISDVISPGGIASLALTLAYEPDPSAPDADRQRGDYSLTLHHLTRYPGGWRVENGASWSELPSAVADPKAQLTLRLLGKESAFQGMDQSDDPALTRLAESLARLVQTRDFAALQNELTPPYVRDFDAFWRMIETRIPADHRPTRDEALAQWKTMSAPFQSSVAALFAQMAQAGIDLHDATIRVRSATVQSLNRGDTADTIEGLGGSQLRITYEVQTTALGKTGRSLSGDYTLMTDSIERRDDHWRLNGFTLQWERLPEGVLDPAALAAQEFENHVARYRTLPPGILAPDITVTQLDGESPLTLASLRGKVVILDFWATWCGPCQPSMAELQKLLADHPTWAGRVVVVSVSIDDDIPTLRKHLEARGWNQTLNTWAGPGGWQSATAKTFRVSSVPTSYLIAPDGKISGSMSLPDRSLTRRVDALLAAPAAKPQTPPASTSR